MFYGRLLAGIINKNGNIIEKYIELIKKDIEKSKKNNETKLFAELLNQYLKILIDFTNWIEESMKNSKDDVSAACNDYLRVLGLVAVGYSWLRILDIKNLCK